MRLAAAAVTLWHRGQAWQHGGSARASCRSPAFPLPLRLAGLSSLLLTMTALGMLMCFARKSRAPQKAIAAAGPGVAPATPKLAGPGPRHR